jgi:hypothetical protein
VKEGDWIGNRLWFDLTLALNRRLSKIVHVYIDGEIGKITVNHHNFNRIYTLELQQSHREFVKFIVHPNIHNYGCLVWKMTIIMLMSY